MPDQAPLDDIEIVMHLYRLARTGRYREHKSLLLAAQEDFPRESEERLRKCMVQLANRLKQNN